ncbi:MAG: hypothetical protein JW809_03325 [Pirellulales bacterium]|nr:hypothetical protein [Pirellulales bacterium]
MAGSSTNLVCESNGTNWVTLFNSDDDDRGRQFAALVDPLVRETVGTIRDWPEADLFGQFFG